MGQAWSGQQPNHFLIHPMIFVEFVDDEYLLLLLFTVYHRPSCPYLAGR